MSPSVSRFLAPMAGTGLVVALPLLGAVAVGHPAGRYLQFPPRTRYVVHAPFSWTGFAAVAALIAAMVLPLVIAARRAGKPPRPAAHAANRPLPWWGWAALAAGAGFWILAWSRFAWMEPLQRFTFTPLWLCYVVAVNALAWRRRGACLLTAHPGKLAMLFPLSAAFWWLFEYLNRFVQNWHYLGVGRGGATEYVVHASIAFSTVLPAVLSTYDLLAARPGAAGRFDFAHGAGIRGGRTAAVACLAAGAAGLVFLPVRPDLLFPMVWIAPALVAATTLALAGRRTLVSEALLGRWRRIVLLAAAALICGVFWEMWNWRSLAQWVYCVPYVQRFHLFEMPLLGYAGYLPFGVECGLAAELVNALPDGEPPADRAAHPADAPSGP